MSSPNEGRRRRCLKACGRASAATSTPIYETYETPYTVYSVFKGQTKIGIVHGVNVPGKGGVIQVFLSTDPATGADQESSSSNGWRAPRRGSCAARSFARSSPG